PGRTHPGAPASPRTTPPSRQASAAPRSGPPRSRASPPAREAPKGLVRAALPSSWPGLSLPHPRQVIPRAFSQESLLQLAASELALACTSYAQRIDEAEQNVELWVAARRRGSA